MSRHATMGHLQKVLLSQWNLVPVTKKIFL